MACTALTTGNSCFTTGSSYYQAIYKEVSLGHVGLTSLSRGKGAKARGKGGGKAQTLPARGLRNSQYKGKVSYRKSCPHPKPAQRKTLPSGTTVKGERNSRGALETPYLKMSANWGIWPRIAKYLSIDRIAAQGKLVDFSRFFQG